MNGSDFSYESYYKNIASRFDKMRLDGVREITKSTSIVSEYVSKRSGTILDIGCGTGRYSAYLRSLGYDVVGLDKSRPQLLQESASIPIANASSTNIPFRDCSFAGCLLFLVLQQLSGKERTETFQESRRVLKNRGFLFVKTVSHEDLRKRPFNDVFPSSLGVNLERYPDTAEILSNLKSTGYVIEGVIPTFTEQELDTSDLLWRVRNKHNTTLALITDQDFLRGYEALKERYKGVKSVIIPHYHTVLVARKQLGPLCSECNHRPESKIMAVRHFETLKNVRNIHGYCREDKITESGIRKAHRIASIVCKIGNIKGITYFDTVQAKSSAILLSRLTKIPLEAPFSLGPYHLGAADGKSHEELRFSDSASALSLELFRARVIDATKLRIKNSESARSLECRLLKWWKDEGKERCVDRVVVGSNSTLLMLTNLLEDKLPSSGGYMCFAIPTGAVRVWYLRKKKWTTHPPLSKSRCPELQCRRIQTEYGGVQTTVFLPGWENKQHTCIIIPGYFGNSRIGPYGIYVKIARTLAFEGIECVTLDYLGSGESDSLFRTFDSDLFSVESTISKIPYSNKISVLGHCSGSAVAAKLSRSYPNISGFAIAPVCLQRDLHERLLSLGESHMLRQKGYIVRKGVFFPRDYAKSMENAWKNHARELKGIILAEDDEYFASHEVLKYAQNVHTVTVGNADHNFSAGNSSQTLIDAIKRILINDEDEVSS